MTVDKTPYISAGATISPCGTYRYRLWREWRLFPTPAKWDMWVDDDGTPIVDGAGKQLGEPLTCLFVMLNPSTADGEIDDPTIRRCVAYAKAWGYDRMEVVNLFAYRATDPKQLLALGHRQEPWGVSNQRYVIDAARRAGVIVCAWGAHGGHLGQDEAVLGWLAYAVEGAERDVTITALKLTKEGHPAHPLYLRSDLQPFPWERAQ